jgi:carbon storage regulator
MLVLTREPGERVMIGDAVVVEILAVDGDRVRLGLTAPGLRILREELIGRGSHGDRQPTIQDSQARGGPEGSDVGGSAQGAAEGQE